MNSTTTTYSHLPGLTNRLTQKAVYIRETYKGSEKLQNKVALISGGDSGIGKAVALHFAREGADIALIYHPTEEEDAYATKELIEKEHQKCLLICGDLLDPFIPGQAVQAVMGRFGQIDILVNNAAVQRPNDDFTTLSDQQWEETFEVNVFACFRLTREALKYMKAGAAVINTASVLAYQGHGGLIDYAATKGALISFTRSLSQNLAAMGIRVNAVAPGPVLTPLVTSTLSENTLADFGKDTPLQRAGQPCEVATAYVFLASQDSSYVSGQVLHPNGGKIINT
ncbi:SDR family oxidoreductase [Runella slithyformis]|uniref:3-oxoacyl-(Acyl-carrier-protein) reductase n=1 Tax=Runella slithyformis (strain ATCC 29530 / DSM 19594 / LMG 11500 / NCIMB 11436 / LSU 4) TaxID=761193 RepID=A0A7U3ZRX7_RUNSL|nr:SDR family oxidoreductase [Runella slithyformis]AEI52251.1 3-oxoacyl-(acyl-carrier-protein) reductase [Runella slithyformis DSM 19594]